jgi:Transcription factor WhiB
MKIDALTMALLNLAEKGVRTPCSDAPYRESGVVFPNLWLSDNAGKRSVAAKLCRSCPVIEPCLESAQARDERHGVWGGVDLTQRPGKKKAA